MVVLPCMLCLAEKSTALWCSDILVFKCPPHFTNIAGITVMTIDLVHNTGLVIIRNVVLRMGENAPKCPEGLHVDLNINPHRTVMVNLPSKSGMFEVKAPTVLGLGGQAVETLGFWTHGHEFDSCIWSSFFLFLFFLLFLCHEFVTMIW